MFLPLLVNFFSTLLYLFFFSKVAKRFGIFLDIPKEERKIHRGVALRIGGLSIILSTLTVSLLFKLAVFFKLFLSFFPLLAVSLYEDFKEVSYRVRFLFQFLSATLGIFLLKTYIVSIGFKLPPFLGIPLSIFAVAGGTNAFNLIDGVNGLASSIALVTLLTYGYTFFSQNLIPFGVLSLLIASSLLAFIPVNLLTGRVFLGDTGSYFLGFTISLLSITAAGGLYTDISPWFAVVTLFYPIWETLFSYTRRKLEGKNPFTPDKEHMHHRLLNLFGGSHLKTTLTIAGFQASLDLLAVVFSKNTPILFGISISAAILYTVLYRKLSPKGE